MQESNDMTKAAGGAEIRPKAGANPVAYVVAVLSVTPILGVLFGLIAVVWGLATLKHGGRIIAIIGAAGLCGQSLVIFSVVHLMSK